MGCIESVLPIIDDCVLTKKYKGSFRTSDSIWCKVHSYALCPSLHVLIPPITLI